MRVTQLLRYVGLAAELRCDPWYAKRGTLTHKAIELDSMGTLDYATLDPELKPAVDGWRAFRSECAVHVHLTEQGVDGFGVTGTMDALISLEAEPGVRYVCDIKRGVKEPWHRWQIALYRLLAWHSSWWSTDIRCGPPLGVSVYLDGVGKYHLSWWRDQKDLDYAKCIIGFANVLKECGR